MSLPSIAWTEHVARQYIDKFLRASGRQRSMVTDRKCILLKASKSQSSTVPAPSTRTPGNHNSQNACYQLPELGASSSGSS